LCLAACAPKQIPEVPETHEHRLVGDAESVTVVGGENADHAAPYAEQYCAMYGKAARFRGIAMRGHGIYTKIGDVKFDCVARDG
jgi:hypothetical protein